MAKIHILMAVLLPLMLAGCGGVYRVEAPADSELAEADWSNARSCTLRVGAAGVEADNLVFVAGEASVLEIHNDTEEAQSFESVEFFRDIKAWKLVTVDRSSKLTMACGPMGARITGAPQRVSELSFENVGLKAIDTKPGQRKLLYFVPKKAGFYSFECALFLDATCTTSNTITVLAASGS